MHAYLDKVSEEKLLKECEQQLLANHQTALLDKEETGCRALLREQKTEGNPDACFGCAHFHSACFCHGKHRQSSLICALIRGPCVQTCKGCTSSLSDFRTRATLVGFSLSARS